MIGIETAVGLKCAATEGLRKMKRISRRQFMATAAVAPVAFVSMRAQRPSGAPPNIVFILADDLGYADLSCYGRPDFTTPNCDRLAGDGMRFLQAYANSAVCSATRTALITGRYQYRLACGLEEPIAGPARHAGLPPEHPTLPSLLKKAGYTTALIGKWHLGFLPDFGPLKSGYDHFWGFRSGALDYYTHKPSVGANVPEDLWDGDARVHQVGYLTDLLGERASAFIKDSAQAHKPFMLSLHFNAPHWPWEGPGDEAEAQRVKALFDTDGGSQKTYARMVQAMDAQVGRVMASLEAAGVAGNTIVIFSSDNGGERFADTWPFTGKKTELLEGGLRIPAIVRWPGRVRAGSTTAQVAISMDWVPTLLEAAGAEPDPKYPLDGVSLTHTLTRNAAPVPRKLFWRYLFNRQQAMRDGDLKYLKIAENTFLFNVVEDPLERANLKNREPETYKRLVDDYNAWDATMLPLDPKAFTHAMFADEFADHFGNKRPATGPASDEGPPK
jgi:arylsulfatase A-like enzyme